MCVLQPCANPTEVGVWWRDDIQWKKYGAGHERTIREGIRNRSSSIDLGTIASTVYPNGARYTANLNEMVQIANSSGQRRPIMVIDSTARDRSPPRALPAPQPSVRTTALAPSPIVQYRDENGNLQRYESGVAEALLQLYAGGAADGNLKLVQNKTDGDYYVFDLINMIQYDVLRFDGENPVLSETAPRMVVIEVPWHPVTMASLTRKADAALRRKVLVMVVEKCKSQHHLQNVLPPKVKPKTIETFVSKSTNARSSAGRLAQEHFLKSLDVALMRTDERFLENFFNDVPKLGSQGPLQMVLKTNGVGLGDGALCVDSSTSSSLCPAKSDAFFWTSLMAPFAAAGAAISDCAEYFKVLVYLVIVPTAGNESTSGSPSRGYVQIENPEHRLQLAEVVVH